MKATTIKTFKVDELNEYEVTVLHKALDLYYEKKKADYKETRKDEDCDERYVAMVLRNQFASLVGTHYL